MGISIRTINGYKIIKVMLKNSYFEVINLKGTEAWIVSEYKKGGFFIKSSTINNFSFKHFLSNIML